jgi:hypothetical protein
VSHYDYQVSKQIGALDAPFYALVMALYRQADTANQGAIERAWPETVAELRARYEAPGGLLPGEPGYEEIQRQRHQIGMQSS